VLKVDPSTKTLVAVSSTTLTQANILERTHLQEAIVRSWDAFISEMGYEELFLVGAEIVPHDSCRDRIDLLAISREGTPVVFELKRHRDRLQLLQAVSYAAMVAKWDAGRFRQALGARNDEDAEELRSLLEDEAFQLGNPEIVLIAESFDPEVILAAEWLAKFGVPISAFAISGVEHRGDTLITIDQRFPLAGVDDVYVRRASRGPGPSESTSWDDALTKVSFPFAKRAVDIFRKRIEGSPHRRQFNSIYSDSPLGRMSIALRKKYLKVYTVDQSAESEKVVRARLEPTIAVSPWGSESTNNSGFTFTIETADQLDHFLKAVGETST
jgi:hypothetical protein